jgi:osmotically-inducible protein OsmY
VIKKGLIGLLLGIASGVAAGILLSPRARKNHNQGAAAGGPALLDTVLDFAEGSVGAIQSAARRAGVAGGEGIQEDERVTLRVRDELQDFALWNHRLDVTTVDGVVYLRGRESDTARADAIVRVVQGIDGVHEVVDEIRRE